MSLEVIGAGFGRTGTLSLKTALERLGFGPCEHMSNLYDDPDRARVWDGAVGARKRGEPVDWRRTFDGHRATVDWPGCSFWKELAVAHPDARVILTVRDPNAWYESVARTIYRPRKLASRFPPVSLFGALVPGMRPAARVVNGTIWDGTFGGRFEDRGYAIALFERHAEEVKRLVPAERLLVYDIREGWGPLCKFLGVEEPDEPFPHLNSATEFRRGVWRRFSLPYGIVSAGVIAILLTLLRSSLSRRR